MFKKKALLCGLKIYLVHTRYNSWMKTYYISIKKMYLFETAETATDTGKLA